MGRDLMSSSDAEQADRPAAGDWLVLVAAAAFVAGTFLPSMRLLSAPEFKNTLYNQTIGSASGFVERIGSFLSPYAGALTAGTIALIGVRLHNRRWVAPALTAAVAAWSLAWVGVLLNTWRSGTTGRSSSGIGGSCEPRLRDGRSDIALRSTRQSARAVEGPRLTPWVRWRCQTAVCTGARSTRRGTCARPERA